MVPTRRKPAKKDPAKKKKKESTGAKKKTGSERRKYTRYRVKMQVDWSSGENFLLSTIENISEMGIFVATEKPLKHGTILKLKFAPQDLRPFEVTGKVMWVNPLTRNGKNINPGMGIKFVNLTDEKKHKIQELITTIAYIHENWI
ncbi:MAG: TIGR02266 family protein [Pseudomonadota bacterium]